MTHWTQDAILAVPMPDENTHTAERHCYEVALDLMFAVEKGYKINEKHMRDIAARLMEGVFDRYSSKLP